MVTLDSAFRQSSPEVLTAVERLAGESLALTADLVALLAVVDERRLYEVDGCRSVFEFCVQHLRLSEAQAYHRIQAARTARRFPVVLERLREGRVTLTSVALLRPVLTAANHERLLAEAEGRSKRDVERLVRGVDPHPDVKPSLRKLAPPRLVSAAAANDGHTNDVVPSNRSNVSPPTSSQATTTEDLLAGERMATPACLEAPVTPPIASLPAPRPAVIRPLAPARYSLHVTLAEETHDKLRRAQDLLAHVVPNGDPAVILDRALTLLVADLERQRFAATKPRGPSTARSAAAARVRRHPPTGATDPRSKAVTQQTPSPSSAAQSARARHIPAAIRRAVWLRDEGRCTAVGPDGRCTETRRLEFHHLVPVADRGATTVENVTLLCTAHHAQASRRWFCEDQPFGEFRRPPNSDRSELAGSPGP